MVATSLQDDLIGIPGVEGAEVDGSQDAPAGLRIRIAQDADQDAVGGAIRRVLSAHGLGTDTQLPGEAPSASTATPPTASGSIEPAEHPVSVMTEEELPATDDLDDSETDEGRTIIDLTDSDPIQPSAALPLADTSSSDEADLPEDSPATSSWDSDRLPPFVEPRPASSIEDSVTMDIVQPPSGQVARLDSIAVVEGRSGITVAVTASDGSETSVAASSTEGGVEEAVVKATARLIDPDSPDPIVVEIEDRRVDGVDIVMIVLDADGVLVTGSAVVSAGRSFALGRAAWAALAL